ncbi:MAG: pantoate--beta-alanine ligase [Myxococcota bacterium]|jgi:pantoate--beta-alanine ligase
MEIFNDISSIRNFLKKHSNEEIGFVPTMGSLHQGHLSLIDLARKTSDIVVVSVFVNQKQFNNSGDFENYPNNLDKDIELLKKSGTDVLFIPHSDEIYGNGFLTNISTMKLGDNLCGKNRVGHFEGVALIVAKLFNIIKPQKAFFGEKDFQQLQIVKKMVFDLNFDVEIFSGKTLREEDGLAMSSRNIRLDDDQREIAGDIYENLNLAKQKVLDGKDIDSVLRETGNLLLKIGAQKVDYLQICDEENLEPISIFNPQIKSRLFIAIYVGEIRLIDNIPL